ncbi:hypothetical protein EK21DRAFT_82064 [Setomelanomma holmii]|uniref:HTH CENPB-type domain-containing protein n=1 Tax=Setomelanomma holmii TaxID=210430 RepID=A0A9P4GWN3_9PLEO|nr:hypothetical protein EK21DRAFT_82064 [Setomelanomma holmii]
MSPIEEALAEIKLQEQGDDFSYTKIAAKHGVVCSTLIRRHRGETTTTQAKNLNQRNLQPQQEIELVRYIEDLSRRRLPPTREMVQNFASQIAQKPVSQR